MSIILLSIILPSLSLDHLQGCVDHPIILTEAVCNPLYSRQMISELLFECYQVPKVSYGVDSLYSFYHNKRQNWPCSGLIISSGYQCTHVLPVLEGRWVTDLYSAAHLFVFWVLKCKWQRQQVLSVYHVVSCSSICLNLNFFRPSLFYNKRRHLPEMAKFWNLSYNVNVRMKKNHLCKIYMVQLRCYYVSVNISTYMKKNRISSYSKIPGVQYIVKKMDVFCVLRWLWVTENAISDPIFALMIKASPYTKESGPVILQEKVNSCSSHIAGQLCNISQDEEQKRPFLSPLKISYSFLK